MPTMKFMNLGPIAGTPGVSVEGNLYALQVTDSSGLMEDCFVRKVAFVFDLRRKSLRRKSREGGTRKLIPDIPPFRVATAEATDSLADVRDTDQVYYIDLVPGETRDLTDLCSVFPRANIRETLQGTSEWFLSNTENGCGNILRTITAIEETEWTKVAERTTVGLGDGVGPFEIFLFPALADGKSASVLVSGETGGRSFSFFMGGSAFKGTLPGDRVKDIKPGICHILSAGTWRVFYSSAESKSSMPVKVAHGG